MSEELPEIAEQTSSGPASPTFDEDFGASLRRARERRGVSLRQIAVSTKISMTSLEALERNDVSRLPGGIFSRAFVRSYASEIGLDPEEAVREFIARFPTEDAGHVTRHIREVEPGPEFDNDRQVTGVVLKLVAVSIPIAAAILYFTLMRGSSSEAEPEPTPTAEPQSMVVPAGDTAATTGGVGLVAPAAGNAETREAEMPETTDAAAAVGTPPGETETGTEASEALSVTIGATGPCWVSVTTDGRAEFARLMDVGDRELQRVEREIILRVGDAGRFSYAINGVPGRALGGAGQVVTVRINRSNFRTYLRP